MSTNLPEIEIIIKNGTDERHINIYWLLATLGLPIQPDQIGLQMTAKGISLRAVTEPKETEYPGITVDGFDSAGRCLYLGNFEAPCPTYPNRIAARLYAGYEMFESDSPIAIITHDVKDENAVKRRTERASALGRPLNKFVYVDSDLATPVNWTDIGEGNMPEHWGD